MTSTAVTTIPAYCPICKRLFASNAFALCEGANVSVHNCTTNCPSGHEAIFLDGSYSLKDKVLQLAASSPDTLLLLKSLAEGAINGDIDGRDAVAKIIDLAPALSPIFSGKSSDLLPWFALLVYLIVEILKGSVFKQPDFSMMPVTITNINNNQSYFVVNGLTPSEANAWSTDRHLSKRQKRRERGKTNH